MPTQTVPAASDPEMQQLYHEAQQRGLFADPEMQQLGHELRARGMVSDPTQGGRVAPPAPFLLPSSSDPDGDPADNPHAPQQVVRVLPPSAPVPAQSAAPAPAAPVPHWRRTVDNTFGTGDHEGDVHKTLHAILPGLKAAYHAADQWSEGLGEKLLSVTGGTTTVQNITPAQHAANAQRLLSQARQGGAALIPPTVKDIAAGVPASTIVKNTLREAQDHPFNFVLNALPFAEWGALSVLGKAAKLDGLAAAAEDAEHAAQAAQMRTYAKALRAVAQPVHDAVTAKPVRQAAGNSIAALRRSLGLPKLPPAPRSVPTSVQNEGPAAEASPEDVPPPAAEMPPAQTQATPRGRQKPALPNPVVGVPADPPLPPVTAETAPAPETPAPEAPAVSPAARVDTEKQFATDAGAEFTPAPDDAQPPPAKVKTRTGMTQAQEDYLSTALHDYAKTDAAQVPETVPYTSMSGQERVTQEFAPHSIDVPGDGTYTVRGMQQANALHVNLTGKGITLHHYETGEPFDLNALYKHKPGAGDGGDPLTTGRRTTGGVSVPRLNAAQKADTLAKYADPFAEEPSDLPQPKHAAEDTAKPATTGPHEAILPHVDVPTIAANLAKVKDAHPDVQALAAAVQSHVDVHTVDGTTSPATRRVPRIDSSAGLFGGAAVSDVLENAHDRVGAIVAHATQAAANSDLGRAARNGRYRASYEVDTSAGDGLNQLSASGESARTYAHYATRHIQQDLSPAQKTLLVDYLLDERATAIEADGGTPNRADLRPLTAAEKQQVQTDPKLQAALLRFRHGPMGTIERLRSFVSPRLKTTRTDSGDFLSLLAKEDAGGNAINARAGSGKPASGMSVRGTVSGTSHARQATGTGQAYSHDLGEILTHALTEVNHKANLKQFYKTLLATQDAAGNRLAYSSALKGGKALPDTIHYNGTDYPAVDVSPGYKYVDKNGQAREVRIRVPAPIAHDLEDALTRPRPGNDLGAVLHKGAGFATSLSLMTPAELTNHVGRMISVVAKMPPVGAPLAARLSELAVPHAGPRAGALYRMFNTDMSDPENVAVLQRVMDANGGSGRPFSHELGDSILSRVPGLSKVQNLSHDFLFGLPEGKGMAGFDLRLRVMAEKMRAAAEGNTDPQRVREFANQFGQYSSKPEKLIENIRKIAPFAATSLPVKLTEMRLLMGDAGFKNLTPKQHAVLKAETLFRGTAGTIMGYALLNHLLSGHWPWQNAKGHETDLQAGHDRNGKPVYIGGNRVDPTLSRPLATLGVPDMITDLRHHPPGSLTDALAKDAGRGLYNTAGSSVSSPALQALTTLLAGHDPLYLTRGGQLLQTAEHASQKNGESQTANNVRAAVGGLNPALGAVLHTDTESRERPFRSPLWRTVQQMERLTGPVLKQDALTPKERAQQARQKATAPKRTGLDALRRLLHG